MKNKILAALALILFAGCGEEFYKVDPQGDYFNSNYYASENQVYGALVAAYDPLQYSFLDGRYVSTVWLGEIWSDNANAGGDASNADQPGWHQIDDLVADPLTGEVRSVWRKYYQGISKTNQLLTNVRVESALVDQYVAEAKFLRAYYHFELARTYGPVPVITEVKDPFERSIARQPLVDVYTQVEKDLLEAIPLLPVSYSDPAMAGRATKGAAQALLGKAYLYWADLKNDDVALFDKAAEQLQAVINSGQYELVDDFNALWAFGAANTQESVFEIQYTNLVPASWADPGTHISGNMIVQLSGIRSLAGHDDYQPGWGFMLPTEDLYDSYLADDTYRRSATIISMADLQAAGATVPSNDQNPIDLEGYWQKKYANYAAYSAPAGDPNLGRAANQPVIRYADVLLMAAEALVRGNGDESQAIAYVNLVRERAAGPGDNTATYRDVEELMADEGWTLLEAIWYERRAELAGEGDRWFDLVRSGRANADVFESGNLRNTNFDEKDLYLPIPQREVELTGGSLTAYPDASLFF